MFDQKFTRREFLKISALTSLAFAVPNFFTDVDKVFAAHKDCTIKTRYGTYKGFVGKKGVQTWLGIPYAKPPIDSLRWHSPEMLDPSDKIFNAKKFGFSPLQDIDEVEPASLNEQSEDCLTLNIWTSDATKRKPVMVFIPGGGFINGGSGDPLYDGNFFAANNDVVFVTINYRLNVFGFMNFSSIDSSYESSGYLGIQDQVMALKWVKENIENFGGDPDNITIFGESAGAASVMLLSVTPAARGLFDKVISQSGHLTFYHPPEESVKLAEHFMEFGGFKNMDELRNKSAEEIRKIYENFILVRMLSTEIDYFPTADGKFLPLNPFKALMNGAAKDIKFMTGTTEGEYFYWLLYYEEFIDIMPDFHAKINPVIYNENFTNNMDIYRAWRKNHPEIKLDDTLGYLAFANQLDWRVGQELAAEYQSKYNDVYFYLFSQKSPIEKLGSCHAIDLPFVFGNPSPDIEGKPDKNLIKQVQATWTAFATTGKPDNDLIPEWKKYAADNRQTMEINAKGWACHKDLNAQTLGELRYLYEDNLLK
ncbi:MAG: carboxylesterase family protein [Selenomonadaceae bacterium]|nr:carboxylesterase family protein [Selenomonadaceae bacterium]